jgi:hypothetical protein
VVTSDHEIAIGPDRRLAFGATVFLGLIFFVGIVRAIANANVESGIFILVIIGVPFGVCARTLLQRGPTLLMDEVSIRGAQAEKAVRWDQATDIYVRQERGIFSEFHILMITNGANMETIGLSLDQLSMSWQEIVALVERRAARHVPIKRDARLRLRRSSDLN